MPNSSPDVPETRHGAINGLLNIAVGESMRFESHRNQCEYLQQSGKECDECERMMIKAQESKRDILRFIDEHYRYFPPDPCIKDAK